MSVSTSALAGAREGGRRFDTPRGSISPRTRAERAPLTASDSSTPASFRLREPAFSRRPRLTGRPVFSLRSASATAIFRLAYVASCDLALPPPLRSAHRDVRESRVHPSGPSLPRVPSPSPGPHRLVPRARARVAPCASRVLAGQTSAAEPLRSVDPWSPQPRADTTTCVERASCARLSTWPDSLRFTGSTNRVAGSGTSRHISGDPRPSGRRGPDCASQDPSQHDLFGPVLLGRLAASPAWRCTATITTAFSELSSPMYETLVQGHGAPAA